MQKSNGNIVATYRGTVLWITGLDSYTRVIGNSSDSYSSRDEFYMNISAGLECRFNKNFEKVCGTNLLVKSDIGTTLVIVSPSSDGREIGIFLSTHHVDNVIFLSRPQRMPKSAFIDYARQSGKTFITQPMPQVYIDNSDNDDIPYNGFILNYRKNKRKTDIRNGKEPNKKLCEYFIDFLLGILGNILTGNCNYLSFFGIN